MERIIAKIDNDFNPDNSDWVPRVAAWTIDCMSQLKVLRIVKKRRCLKVIERIAVSPCPITEQGLVVYDDNGCKIDKLGKNNINCKCSFTGEHEKENNNLNINISTKQTPNVLIKYKNSKSFEDRHNVGEEIRNNINKSYVIIDNNKIELNFETNNITIENDEIDTYYSNYFNCELPVVPNNGLLIEAISIYCMYKMLSRGYKHPVFSLNGNNPSINPFLLWRELYPKAKASVINSIQGTIDSNMWQTYFYNYTFSKR